jgi:hypothetical protein
MPVNKDEMLTTRGLVRVLGWDAFDCDTVNIDVEITSYDYSKIRETWYHVPRHIIPYLGIHVDARYVSPANI